MVTTCHGVFLAPEKLLDVSVSIRERCLWLPSDGAIATSDRVGLTLWEIRYNREGTSETELYGLYSAALGEGSWLHVQGCKRQDSELLDASSAYSRKEEAAGFLFRDGSLQLLVPFDPILLALPWLEKTFYVDQPQPWSLFVESLCDSKWFLEHLDEERVAKLVLVIENASAPAVSSPARYRFSMERALRFLLAKLWRVKTVLSGANETERLRIAIDVVAHMVGHRWARRLTATFDASV
ncbi:hypothetical protein F1559_001849 [Cyanidiococcus yangmingshanensis]|uniref:Uncharacterized protein n=1 Tax=Cyanidiococcus yangmingshanensis TaxID=2690220 RepID=A0A7J7IKH3_9RHOD|nr:hypothetical protein F1559_001849 [Cyanidiococcus yangmingshanensis]